MLLRSRRPNRGRSGKGGWCRLRPRRLLGPEGGLHTGQDRGQLLLPEVSERHRKSQCLPTCHHKSFEQSKVFKLKNLRQRGWISPPTIILTLLQLRLDLSHPHQITQPSHSPISSGPCGPRMLPGDVGVDGGGGGALRRRVRAETAGEHRRLEHRERLRGIVYIRRLNSLVVV